MVVAMGQHYSQLRLAERLEIHRLRAAGKSLTTTGAALGRSASTIARELSRNAKPTNAWRRGYDPERAQALAERRRRWDGRFKMARQPALQALVRRHLAMGWSPEQIAGRLAREDAPIRISHESIYRFVYHRSAQKDYWHRLLPQRKNRRGHLRRGGISPVLTIKQRTSIHERPPHVEARRQAGHWEADLMCFAKYDQAVLVVHERTSRALIATRQPSKAAVPVVERLDRLFRQMPPPLRRTVTFDNGTEFALHYRLKEQLGIKTYFCDPHAPWQKGGVENAISRLRRPLPRKADLAQIHPRKFDAIIASYNATPRRCLGFRTPAEVFWDLFNPLHFNRETSFPPPRE